MVERFPEDDFNPERGGHERLVPQQLLQTTIMAIHRNVAVDSYRQFGMEIEEYDRELMRAYDESHDMPGLGLVVSEIEFDKGQYPKPVHIGEILGYAFFVLQWSGTTDDYLNYLEAAGKDQGLAGADLFDDIESEAKALKVNLLSHPRQVQQQSNPNGLILFGHDMPPTAMHMDDVRYAQTRLNTGGRGLSLSLISQVQSLFGDEAAVKLSDNSCLALIRALRRSRASSVSSNDQ